MIQYDADQAAFYREKLAERVQTDVRDCYQCGNCTASCPAAFTFDYTPNQLMRMLQIGLIDRVLDSKAIQLCVQCLTCTGRCPRNIDIAGIFEDLKTVAAAQDRKVPEHVKTFNETFMGAVARFGRLPEFYDMAMFYTRTMDPEDGPRQRGPHGAGHVEAQDAAPAAQGQGRRRGGPHLQEDHGEGRGAREGRRQKEMAKRQDSR